MRYEAMLAWIGATALVCGGMAIAPGSLLPFAAAQSNPALTNVVPESAAISLRAKIRVIDMGNRKVTLQGESGSRVTVVAGPRVRLKTLKKGDIVNVKYYRSVVFLVTPPRGGNGTPVANDQMSQVIARPVQGPGGVGMRMTRVSGTVVGVDMAAHTVDMVNPSGGGVYTIEVTDPARIAMLSSFHIGNTVTAAVSQTLAVTIERAPSKTWF